MQEAIIDTVFQKPNQLVLIKGESGVGKTFLVETAFQKASCKKKIRLITYDNLKNEKQFNLDMYSARLDGYKTVIVIDNFESFSSEEAKIIVAFTQKRTNAKRTIDFKPLCHSSTIILIDTIYKPFIKQLIVPFDCTFLIGLPLENEKLQFFRQYFSNHEITNESIKGCNNYHDLTLRLNEMKYHCNHNNNFSSPEITKNYSKRLKAYHQSQQNLSPSSSNKQLFNHKNKDVSLFRENIFHAINAIRQQIRPARGLKFNVFDKFSQFEPKDVANKYHALLLSSEQAQSFAVMEDISSSQDTFCETDLRHFPYFIEEAFYEVAMYQSPVYTQEDSYVKPLNNFALKNAFQWGKMDEFHKDLILTMKSVSCFGSSLMDFLVQMWTIYDFENLLQCEIFPPGFLNWNEDHRKAQNKEAISHANFSFLKPSSLAIPKPVFHKKRKLFDRDKANQERKN